jgi:hypothetical protein
MSIIVLDRRGVRHRPATIRVMHDGDVVYVEKVARDADRSLRAAGCAAAGNDDRKDRGVRTDFLFPVFADEFEDLSRVDLAGGMPLVTRGSKQ